MRYQRASWTTDSIQGQMDLRVVYGHGEILLTHVHVGSGGGAGIMYTSGDGKISLYCYFFTDTVTVCSSLGAFVLPRHAVTLQQSERILTQQQNAWRRSMR